MPKIAVTSDLHLGITEASTIRNLVSAIASEEPALTVLAGDIGEGLPNIAESLKLFTHLPGDVAVLAGNHDVWAQANYASQDLWEHHLPTLVQAAGMIWLEETVWQRDSVAVAGSLAWYDYSAADPALPFYRPGFFAGMKSYYNRDAEYVDWSWPDREFASRLGDALCKRLQNLEADPNVSEILLVTHVPIFEEQLLRKPHDFDWGFSNAYFGNLTLGQQVLETSKKIRAVMSGHTHIGREGKVRHPKFPKGHTVSVSVLASDYHAPVYAIIDTTAREMVVRN
jgi:3',5'-cyclic AMP phosphodiesterase CpdA